MMAKKLKSPHAKETGFNIEVCNAIRHHLGEIAALESRRKIAFDDRDHLEEQIAGEDLDGDDALDIKAQHSDAVRLIDDLKADIKWHQDELHRMVRQADEPGIEVLYDRPPDPPKPKPKDEAADVPGQLTMTMPAKPEALVADGVDQHLAASVTELQLGDSVTKRLVELGYRHINQIVHDLDKEVDLEDAGLTGPQAAKVRKAIDSYRKTHRKAMRDAEGG